MTTKAEALRNAAPLLAALVREDRAKNVDGRSQASPSAEPSDVLVGAEGDLSGEAA